MDRIIGIDIGISNTKIVSIDNNELRHKAMFKTDRSAGFLDKQVREFLSANGLLDIKKIRITGVGVQSINWPVCGFTTVKTNEFEAIGRGGIYSTALKKAIVVSMGTGTAMVKAEDSCFEYVGGTSIGGGTLLGLGSLILKENDIQALISKARGGDPANVDLLIRDITAGTIPDLPAYAIASNFGKLNDCASEKDIALSLINMILQIIGQTAVCYSRQYAIRDIVLIGNLVNLPQCHDMFTLLAAMFHCEFHIPEDAEYRIAFGAALADEEYRG